LKRYKAHPASDLLKGDEQRQRDIIIPDGYVPEVKWPGHLLCITPGCNNIKRQNRAGWKNTCEDCSEDPEKRIAAKAIREARRKK